MRNNVTLKTAIISIALILLYFQIYIQSILPFFSYYDEFLASLLFILYFLNCIFKPQKNDKLVLLYFFALILIGVISNFTYKYQIGFVPIVLDIFSCLKVFFGFFGAMVYFRSIKDDDKRKIIRIITIFLRIFTLIVFFFGLLNFFGIVDMTAEYRYGIKAYQFINDGSGQLSFMFYSLLFIFTINAKYCNQKERRINFVFILIALFTWLLTLRTRSFIFVIVYLFIYFYFSKSKTFKLNVRILLVFVGIIILLGREQYEVYFGNEGTARYNLLHYGLETFKNHFPLGSGFATYGTDMAFKYYSKLYFDYGFSSVWGLSPTQGLFANDSYWPAVIAQFGLFGTVFVILIIGKTFSIAIKKARCNKYSFIAVLFICFTQLVSSIATATFFHFVTVCIFVMLPLSFEEKKHSQSIVYSKFNYSLNQFV